MIYAALATLVLTTSGAQAESMTNASVLTLVKANLGDEVVIAKIRSGENNFDLSTDQVIALKQQGVSSAVLAAMIVSSTKTQDAAKMAMVPESPDPMLPHPSGVYILANWLTPPKMIRIDATSANQTKTSDLIGYSFTLGIVPITMKSVLPNPSARVQADAAQPTFYFYFDQANQGLSTSGSSGVWQSGAAASVTTPSEFSLVRFDVKKDRREVRVGSFNIAGAKSGVMDKDRIAFSYAQVMPGVFSAKPANALPPGEYGFLYSISAGSGPGMFGGGVMTARVFDFAIK